MSDRYICHLGFGLHVRALVGAWRDKKSAGVQKKYFGKTGNPKSVPVALRWTTKYQFGFPREPFEVFRRQRQWSDVNEGNLVLKDAKIVDSAENIEIFTGDFLYLVRCRVTVNPGDKVTITARDITGTLIPGQYILMEKNGLVEFRCPGIYQLKVVVSGEALEGGSKSSIGPIWTVGQNKYANLTDWERIETVGLPLQKSDIRSGYDARLQGFEPPVLDGVAAAVQRVNIAAALQLDPPPTGITDFPVPIWPDPTPIPNPLEYVKNLRGENSLVPVIRHCLEQSDDSDPKKMQAKYEEQMELEGIKQTNVDGAVPDPEQKTTVTLPVTAVALIAVTTDSFAATALGYGTTDIPPLPEISKPITRPLVDAGITFDYMVTAPFAFPMFSLRLAALSAAYPDVTKPSVLSATIDRIYPPVPRVQPGTGTILLRNQPKTATIRLSWNAPNLSQGYWILVSRTPNQSLVLNAPRPSGVGGYDSYLGVTPACSDPNLFPDQQLPHFWDYNINLPIYPPATTSRYLVAGLDVFGIWSTWTQAQIILSPDDKYTRPGLQDAKFPKSLLDIPGDGSHRISAALEINFAWDWQDRSPHGIMFTGHFVDPKASLADDIPVGFAMDSSVLPVTDPPVVVTFKYNDGENPAILQSPADIKPEIKSDHAGTVEIIPGSSPDPDSQGVHYRLTLSGMMLDFTAVDKLAFAMYISGCESIHQDRWSPVFDPERGYNGRIVRVSDPIPPRMMIEPPPICWTALPDARGVARGILKWTADEKAAGYNIWEATESAFVDIPLPDQINPPSIIERAIQLRDYIAKNPDICSQVFSRLNDKPVEASQTEVLLPAAASVLYAYRVSAVSRTNMESSISDEVAIFAVSRRNTPNPPRLMLRRATIKQENNIIQTGIDVIISPVEKVFTGGTGTIIPTVYPERFRIFRIRSPELAGFSRPDEQLHVPSMGPPKYDIPSDPEETEKIIRDTDVHPSWYPYYYRVTAVGHNDPENGEHGGESGYSPMQAGHFLPQGSPLLEIMSIHHMTPIAYHLTLKTDLPAVKLDQTPWYNQPDLSSACVEILHIGSDPEDPERIRPVPVDGCRWVSQLIPDESSMPPFGGVDVVVGHSDPDTFEQWVLHLFLPSAMVESGDYVLRLTDPLGRRSEYLIRGG